MEKAWISAHFDFFCSGYEFLTYGQNLTHEKLKWIWPDLANFILETTIWEKLKFWTIQMRSDLTFLKSGMERYDELSRHIAGMDEKKFHYLHVKLCASSEAITFLCTWNPIRKSENLQLFFSIPEMLQLLDFYFKVIKITKSRTDDSQLYYTSWSRL